MMVRLFFAGPFMAAAALILVQIGKTTYDSLEVGQTMALVGLALMNIFLALNLRFPRRAPSGATLSNPKLLLAFAWAVIGTMLITEVGFQKNVFHTTPLTIDQWGICLVPGVILLVIGEIFKVILRARRPHEEPAAAGVSTG
jgi:Ca2+-transporting ATPase